MNQRVRALRIETAVSEDIGSSGLPMARRYCPRCGSSFTAEPDAAPEVMMVKKGGIDSNEWFRPVMELSSDTHRPCVTPAGAQQFERNPPF